MNKENNSQNSTEKVSSVDQSRRKLTKTAGIAAPVILSLSSKPVWAINCTLSGVLSGNASHPQREEACPKPGMSREFWINNLDCWPVPFKPDDNFDRWFAGFAITGSTGPLFGPPPNGGTLLEVLKKQAQADDAVKTACATSASALANSQPLKNPNANFQAQAGGIAKNNSEKLAKDLRLCACQAIANMLSEQAHTLVDNNYFYPLQDQVIPMLRSAYIADVNGCTPPNTSPPSHLNDATAIYLDHLNPWNP